MSSDDFNRPADRILRHSSGGFTSGFICPKCGHKREMLGRRYRMFRGIKQWLCATCVKGREQ